MLFVDERIGSKDLLRPLQLFGVPAELTRLQFGDFAFVGSGIGGQNVYVGIELKETKDLISSLYSGRFTGHQLPGLISTYDRAWLITEGVWRTGAGGVLETPWNGTWSPVNVGQKRILTNDLESWILTQTIRGGINHAHCQTRTDTIRFISVLFHWWTDCQLDDHRSHQNIYLPPPDRATFVEPSVERKMLSCIPKVGWDKSAALEEHFGGSIRQVLHASEKELLSITGIGPVIVRNIQGVR